MHRFAPQRRGQIVDVWSPRAFILVGHQFPENEALLLVTRAELTSDRSGAAASGFHGASVRVTGTVLTGIDAAERELDLPFSEAVHSLANGTRPVFVADRVVVARERSARVSRGVAVERGHRATERKHVRPFGEYNDLVHSAELEHVTRLRELPCAREVPMIVVTSWVWADGLSRRRARELRVHGDAAETVPFHHAHRCTRLRRGTERDQR